MSEKARREFVNQMVEVYRNNLSHLEEMCEGFIDSYLEKIQALCRENPDCEQYDYCFDCPVGKLIEKVLGVAQDILIHAESKIYYAFRKGEPRARVEVRLKESKEEKGG